MGTDEDWFDNVLEKMDDKAIESMKDYDDEEKVKKEKEKKEKIKTVQEELPNVSIIEESDTKRPGRPQGDKWSLTPRMMMKIISKKKIVKHYNGNFYLYSDGRYNNRYKGEPIEIKLGMDAEDIFYDIKDRDESLGNNTSTNYIKEMCGHFQRTHHTFDEDIDRNLIGVKNGILSIKKYPYEMMRPDPGLFTAINLPVRYDPDADAVEFKKFTRSLLIKKFIDEDGNFIEDSKITLEKQMQVFEEMLGYPLEYGYPIKKAILLLGPPNCGKTTYYKVMDNFFGLDNISAVSLYDLGDKNRPAEMVGKLVNNVADIGYNTLERRTIENFMNYTGGEGKIIVEKKYRDPFQYMPSIKMYFGSNYTPYVNLNNEAFLGRWTIIKFPDNNFPFDGNFINKLITEKEKSGILNLALEGLMRLRKNKDFSFRQNLNAIKNLFKRHKLPDNDGYDTEDINQKMSSPSSPQTGSVDKKERKERNDKGLKKGQNKRRIGDEDTANIGG